MTDAKHKTPEYVDHDSTAPIPGEELDAQALGTARAPDSGDATAAQAEALPKRDATASEKATHSKPSRDGVTAAGDATEGTLPDWLPWAVLFALMAVGVLGVLGFFGGGSSDSATEPDSAVEQQ